MERVAVAGLSLHQTDVGGLERIKRGLAALEEPLAKGLGLTGRLLGPLLEQVIGFGKRVRTETDLSRHPVSVVSLGVAFLSERVTAGARIAVIGAGATGAHAARALVAAGHAPAFIVN